MAAMINPPVRVEFLFVTQFPRKTAFQFFWNCCAGERLTTTQVGLVTAASFRT